VHRALNVLCMHLKSEIITQVHRASHTLDDSDCFDKESLCHCMALGKTYVWACVGVGVGVGAGKFARTNACVGSNPDARTHARRDGTCLADSCFFFNSCDSWTPTSSSHFDCCVN